MAHLARPLLEPQRHVWVDSPSGTSHIPPSPLFLSAVKLSSLHIDAVLPDRHPQLLHSQHRPVLAPALSAAAVPRSLYSNGASAALVLAALLPRLLTGHGEPCCGTEAAHRVVGVGVARAHAAVLVRIGGNVGNELLRREREEAREARVGLRRGWKARARHVVVCHGVGDLDLGGDERWNVSLLGLLEHYYSV